MEKQEKIVVEYVKDKEKRLSEAIKMVEELYTNEEMSINYEIDFEIKAKLLETLKGE